eukprot:CAMPEP_0115015108 /NCGR_PEP_ID=MMETSP0216-20121206/26543_1 /TAXON_ID=223996 /ORGANISM="Protocruzia adherens, Strain Boccale" /LENGTH=247 /DNA_ID=CAMNT_0002385107 /DNA_START=44 /DNA_END=787 /DNA_ORIENTATION=+
MAEKTKTKATKKVSDEKPTTKEVPNPMANLNLGDVNVLSLAGLMNPMMAFVPYTYDQMVYNMNLINALSGVIKDKLMIPENSTPKFPLPAQSFNEPPKYVNARQYKRILKRRIQRAKQAMKQKTLERRAHKKYMHESRHRHACSRKRGPGGRFLRKSEMEKEALLESCESNTITSSTAIDKDENVGHLGEDCQFENLDQFDDMSLGKMNLNSPSHFDLISEHGNLETFEETHEDNIFHSPRSDMLSE